MTGRFYRFLTSLSGPFLNALLAWRRHIGKEDPSRLPERRGLASLPRPSGLLVWVHAASVGESQSALILISSIADKMPSANFLVTTGTRTSAALMQKRLPANAVHQYSPLDHPRWVDRFMNHWRPDLALWMESELWPNMLAALRTRSVPAVLVNARLSDRSARKWKPLKGFAREVLGAFSLILAQTDKDRGHYSELGAPETVVTDNLKYSAADLPADADALKQLRDAVSSRPCWVYASTHAGEEALACRVHAALKQAFPGLLTVIVPRHPERRAEVAQTCRAQNLSFALRSECAIPDAATDIYIADTLGELGLFYRVAPVAVIGRSFSDDGGGGHNPIEAAQLGCAVMTGPRVQYQQQIFDEMFTQGAALQCRDEESLRRTLQTLLSDKDRCESLRAAGLAFAGRKVAVLDRVMENIDPLLQSLPARKEAA